MRVWDLDPSALCRQHLLGEHREIHAIWTILTEDRDGYRHHPEVKRWEGNRGFLHRRHEEVVTEMLRRGYNHDSRLPGPPPDGHVHPGDRPAYVDPPERQREILRSKDCSCPRDEREAGTDD